jgi:hypothetical protein
MCIFPQKSVTANCSDLKSLTQEKKPCCGSGIRDEQPGSYFLELRNHFWVKILKFFDADPGSGMETIWIQDGKKSDPG